VALLDKTQALQHLEQYRRRLSSEAEGCVMCALAFGHAQPAPLVDDEHAVVVLNRFACRAGHLMVVAKRHVEHATNLDWGTYAQIQRHVYQASRAVQTALGPVRLFTATLGSAVPLAMSYAHYHVHVIPVPETDARARPANVLSWSSGVVVYTEPEAQDLRERIMNAWPAND
jgi:diadenosine tetraphosphate (Ap4A) HIT family hydrolase